jgi:hypothetical protein
MAIADADRPRMPTIKHLYQNHILDSTRWDFLRFRDDDIIVTTSYKAGTCPPQKYSDDKRQDRRAPFPAAVE